MTKVTLTFECEDTPAQVRENIKAVCDWDFQDRMFVQGSDLDLITYAKLLTWKIEGPE